MKTGGINTLLLITRDRLVRADLAAGRRSGVIDVREEPRPPVDDLPSLVEAALRLGTRRPGRVWVLSSDFWTQTLSLPVNTVAGLQVEEINRALGFEAEPFSGISALEAVAAHVVLPDQNQQRPFWFTEMLAGQLEQIDYVVQQAHGQLIGMGHPGGLPRPLAAELSAAEAWQRVELWPAAIVCIQGGGGRRPTISVRNTDPKPGRWEADVERWQAEQPAGSVAESLHAASGVGMDELAPAHRLSLEDQQGLAGFLQVWAEQLAESGTALPLIRPPQRPMSDASRRMTAVVLGLIAAILCTGVHLGVKHYQDGLERQAALLRGPAQQLAQFKKDGAKLRSRRDDLKKACGTITDDLAHYQQVMQSQRQRLSVLLTVLARCGSDETVIRKIDGAEDEIVLHGVCMQPELATELAGTLAKTLGPQSWQVQPPNKKSRELLVGGGPWEFDLCIKDIGPSTSGQRADAAAGAAHRGEAAMKLTERERLIVLLGPLAIILLGYAWWFNLFARPKLRAAQESYQQALAGRVGPLELPAQQAANAVLQREVDTLEKHKADLDAQAAEVCGHTIDPLRRIDSEHDLTDLFQRHGVQLVATGPASGGGAAKLPKSLSEAIERLGPRSRENSVQVRSLRLSGRFMDVLDAVRELSRAEASPVIPISLTMAEADLSADDRQWTLLVWM